MTTIMVVEDEVIVQKIVKAAVEHLGFQCDIVENGALCLAKLAAEPPPALLLLDLVMPVFDGMQVLEALKKTHPEDRFPLAVFSGKNQQEAVMQAIQLGADDFIIKPFAAGDLIKRVSDLIFVADGERIRNLITNLRIPDPSLVAIIGGGSGRWENHNFYPLSLDGTTICIAIPSGKAPQAMVKLPVEELVQSVGVFRRCAPGWRKVWPRFPV